MWPALPAAEYYGDSATPGCHQPTASLPAAVLAARREGRHPDASHVHCVPVGRGGAQLSPGSLATGTPQAFPVASLVAKAVTFGVAAHRRPLVSTCAADRPRSTRLEPARRLRDVHAGSSRTPSRLASRTRAVWQCRPVPSLSGLLPPCLAPPRPGCPQLQPGCCDSPAVGPFTPPGHTAPRGARPCRRAAWRAASGVGQAAHKVP